MKGGPMAFNKRERYLLILAAVSVAILAGDRLVITPLWKSWAGRSKRIHELRKALVSDRALAERKTVLKIKWNRLLRSSLPRDRSTAEERVLKAVSNWSRNSRLQVSSLKPRWSDDEDEVLKLDCHLSARGNLYSIVNFLYELEKDPLALRVESVALAARDEHGRELSLDVQFSGLILEGSHES
jgi:hypothetical protein